MRDESLVLPSDETLMELYMQEKGSYSAIAAALKLPRYRVLGKLESLGLLNLAGRQEEKRVEALEAIYVRKKSLSECLPAAGMSVRRFEALEHKCGPNMTSLLTKMAHQPTIPVPLACEFIERARGAVVAEDQLGGRNPAIHQFASSRCQPTLDLRSPATGPRSLVAQLSEQARTRQRSQRRQSARSWTCPSRR